MTTATVQQFSKVSAVHHFRELFTKEQIETDRCPEMYLVNGNH